MHSDTGQQSDKALEFVLRLYTGLRTIRIYPTANPQVARSTEHIVKAFKALLTDQEQEVTLSRADGQVVVNGEPLPERDQKRPQVEGLGKMLHSLDIFALTFRTSFNVPDCARFLTLMGEITGHQEQPTSLKAALEAADLDSVAADAKRYVAIREGEHVVSERDLAAGLILSDDELADFVLEKGKDAPGPPSGTIQLSADQLANLAAASGQAPPKTIPTQAQGGVQIPAVRLTGMDPAALARLLSLLPETPVTEEMVNQTVQQLDQNQLNRLVMALANQLGNAKAPGQTTAPPPLAIDENVLRRLEKTSHGRQIRDQVRQRLDASLLQRADIDTTRIPDEVLRRLQDVDWSLPVLITAAEQSGTAEGQDNQDPAAFVRLLSRYEHLFPEDKQQQLAQQAGEALAKSESTSLSRLLTQRFKGVLGERLFNQLLATVSDERLDSTIADLDDRQLNRMIGLVIGAGSAHEEEGFSTPLDNPTLERLIKTHKGPEIERAIALHIDAHLLRQAQLSQTALPPVVQQRLQEPTWSTPVLLTALQHFTDGEAGTQDRTSFGTLLHNFEHMLAPGQRNQVIQDAGQQLRNLEEIELGRLLVQRFKGLFGDELYGEIVNQLSDDKFERLAQQLRELATQPLNAASGFDHDDVQAAYDRLMHSVRGEKMRAVLAFHRDQKVRQAEEDKQQIQTGLRALLKGQHEPFRDPRLAKALPENVLAFLKQGKEELADTLLIQSATGLQHQDKVIRGHAFAALADTAEQLAQAEQWARLAKLLPALETGIKSCEADSQGIGQVFRALAKLIRYHLVKQEYGVAHDVLISLRRMSLGHSDSRLEQAGLCLDGICTEDLLDALFSTFLQDQNQQHQSIAGRLLSKLGNKSIDFLLERLTTSESRFERKRLLALIKETGATAMTILLEKLATPNPWYVQRNIIRLLGEVGAPAHIDAITPFLSHEDIRVQEEVVNAAAKLGGDRLRTFLPRALTIVADPLKIKVVTLIHAHPGEETVRALTDLLESGKPSQARSREALQLQICRALGIIGSRKAIPPLTRLVQSKTVLALGGYTESVKEAAQNALSQIRRSSGIGSDAPETNRTTHDTIALKTPEQAAEHDGFLDDYQEREIFRLAKAGELEQAKQELFDLVVTKAKEKDFATAERLRDRFYDLDAMALEEIIRSGEIIEQEKSCSIRSDDLDIWHPLVQHLTEEEYSHLYHEIREREFKAEEIVVQQGESNDELLFINSGSVKITHEQGGKELFITSLNRGQLLGENFFNASIWTVTVATLTPSRIAFLSQASLEKLHQQLPGLKAKLREYHANRNTINAMLDKKGLDRRHYDRYKLARRIQVQLTDYSGKPIGRGFRAELSDISKGGLAYLIRITSSQNARLLLGRKMKVILPVGGESESMQFDGLAIGVQPFNLLENDYSIHFRFDRVLAGTDLQQILG